MVAQNFRHALFCAFITLIISYPILGLDLVAQGIDIRLVGGEASTYIGIALAVLIVGILMMGVVVAPWFELTSTSAIGLF